jgi:hypothetical protein
VTRQQQPAFQSGDQLQELISKVACLESKLVDVQNGVAARQQGARDLYRGRAASGAVSGLVSENQKMLKGKSSSDVDQKDQRVGTNGVYHYGSSRRAAVSGGVEASAGRNHVGILQSVFKSKAVSEKPSISGKLHSASELGVKGIKKPGDFRRFNASSEEQVELTLREELRELDSALRRRSKISPSQL